MLALAHQQNLLPFAIQLVAVLSGNLFFLLFQYHLYTLGSQFSLLVREPMVAVASLRGSSDEETKAMMTTVSIID